MELSLITYTENPNYPRLMRLNNPGGILISDFPFIGKTTKAGQRTYESFDTYANGVYAMLCIISKYYHEEKARTIEKLVFRYAKPGTEITPFITAIAEGSGFRPRQVIPWKRESIYLIVNEICRYLNGGRNPMIHPDLFAFVWLKF